MKAPRICLSGAQVLLALCISTTGCQGVPNIWKAELKSPDGAWLAIAHTEHDGGFGSAYIGTSVDLESTNGTVIKGKPFNVLDFECPGPAAHPYVLDVPNAGGTIGLRMKWLDSSNLEITYDGNAKVNLQVVKYAGVSISLRDLSAGPQPIPSQRATLGGLWATLPLPKIVQVLSGRLTARNSDLIVDPYAAISISQFRSMP